MHAQSCGIAMVLLVAVPAWATAVTADDAVKQALATAPSLDALRADAAREAALARSVALEDVKLRFEHRSAEQVFGIRTDENGDPYGPLDRTFVVATWQPPDPWQLGLDQWIASTRADAADDDVDVARRNLATEVRQLHARALLLLDEEQTVTAALALSERVKVAVNAQLAASQATSLDANYAELEVLDNQLDVDDITSERQRIEARLARLTGIADFAAAGELPVCSAPPPADAVLASARQADPQLRAFATRRVVLDGEGIKASLRLLPWFDDLRVGYSNQPVGKRDELRVGIGFRLPLFALLDGKGTDVDLRRARLAAEEREAEAEIAADVLTAVERLAAAETLYRRHEAATERVTRDALAAIDAALAGSSVDAVAAAQVHARALRSTRQRLRAKERCVNAALELHRITGDVLSNAAVATAQ